MFYKSHLYKYSRTKQRKLLKRCKKYVKTFCQTFSEKDKNGNLANQGKKHLFKLKSTNNYMDYKKVKEFTWRWQWEKLQEYAHLK